MKIRSTDYPIKKAFSLTFIFLVVLPLIAVIAIFLVFTYKTFYNRAVNNITQMHESLATMIESEVGDVSLTLANMVFANNSASIELMRDCDTDDVEERYHSFVNLKTFMDYTLQFDLSILAAIVNFNSGRTLNYKTELSISFDAEDRHDLSLIREDNVSVSAFMSGSYGRWYAGQNGRNMVYSAVIYPGRLIDSRGSIKSIELFMISDIYGSISKSDTAYSLRRNTIGCTVVLDSESGEVLTKARMDDELLNDYLNGVKRFGYTYVSENIRAGETSFEILTIVRTVDLTGSFIIPLFLILLLASIIAFSVVSFTRLLMKNVITPVTDISSGLKSVEEGNLDMYLESAGYREVSETIDSFNAMVRHQRALIEDYKEKIKENERDPQRLFSAFVLDTIKEEDRAIAVEKLFSRPHVLIYLSCENLPGLDADLMFRHMESNLVFASHCCVSSLKETTSFLIYYRVEKGGSRSEKEMIAELSNLFTSIYKKSPLIIYSRQSSSLEKDRKLMDFISRSRAFFSLLDEETVYSFDFVTELSEKIIALCPSYSRFASALHLCDEKVTEEEREKLHSLILHESIEEGKKALLAFLTAFSKTLLNSGSTLYSFYGYSTGFFSKVMEIEDRTKLSIYANNLISEIYDSSLRELNLDTADMITRARRYIADNYQHSFLSLSDVASYVGLNERYFSGRFAKDCGQSFISYLTELRIQNAKRLLKETDFKVYEIASMCGYSTGENFNKAFRKTVGMSPMEFRKSERDA